jgi:hypothetical protein
MKTQSRFWRDSILFDNLDIALRDLLALEATTVGEPANYPYHNGAIALFTLMDTLHSQLINAQRNPYYSVRQEATRKLEAKSG